MLHNSRIYLYRKNVLLSSRNLKLLLFGKIDIDFPYTGFNFNSM